MPKLTISRQDWMEAASYGHLDWLDRWHKTGALEIRYDPTRPGVLASGPGRARIFDVCTDDKRNALFVALASGQVAYAERLMQLGKFAATRNNEGRTPLHAAALLKEGGERVIPMLAAQGHPIDSVDTRGLTPLLLAINNKHVGNVQALLRAGADANHTPGSDTPLARAVGKGDAQIVEALLASGANPNATTGSFDASVLHVLAANWDQDDDELETERVRILRMLLDAGADHSVVVDDRGSMLTVEAAFRTRQGPETLRRILAEKAAADLEDNTAQAMASRRALRL